MVRAFTPPSSISQGHRGMARVVLPRRKPAMTTENDVVTLDGTVLSHETAAAVEQALTFPLFEAILTRRARRFAVGAALPGGPTAWMSQQPPLPLTAVEQDLLAAAGTGLTGLQLGDWSYRDA